MVVQECVPVSTSSICTLPRMRNLITTAYALSTTTCTNLRAAMFDLLPGSHRPRGNYPNEYVFRIVMDIIGHRSPSHTQKNEDEKTMTRRAIGPMISCILTVKIHPAKCCQPPCCVWQHTPACDWLTILGTHIRLVAKQALHIYTSS